MAGVIDAGGGVMQITPYPLAWPDDQPRSAQRKKSAFHTAFEGALKNVRKSLTMFSQDSGKTVSLAQITSNASWLDPNPNDPGIAIWFEWDGALRCIAVDRYLTVAENLQAVHHVLEARRVELRHAGINMVRTTFRGFIAALPAPGSTPWQVTLDVPANATREQISAAYKAKARELAGRDDQVKLQELNVARDKALAQLGDRP